MPKQTENIHIPVLLTPILEILDEKYGKKVHEQNIFDGTLGGGGYSTEFLNRGYKVFASDLDNEAILKFTSSDINIKNLTTANSSFSEYISQFEDNFFTAIVVDLGFSSNQLEYSGRGFSYQKTDEVLDLRYDQKTGTACFKRLQKLQTPDQLWKILFTFSGEKLSRPIAKSIFNLVGKDKSTSITVGQMVDAVVEAIPGKFLKNKNAILSRIWQALRIWTNNELEILEQFLHIATSKLKFDGILAVVSFHSLEDKIVTKYMRELSKPIMIDDYGNREQYYKVLTPKAILPSESEIVQNPRSRSAMLRILQKQI
jgi:16S rRNA (cytosine1402-N4)-methyltransferase